MKKRSLFVATAMLLVAVLVATGATYAWFDVAQGSAAAQIDMTVANASKLEMKTEFSGGWTQSLTADKMFDTGFEWKDYSTNSVDILNNDFYTEVWEEGVDSPVTFEVNEDGTVASVLVYFRSPVQGDVKISNIAFGGIGDARPEMSETARVAISKDYDLTNKKASATTIFAETAGTISNTVNGVNTTAGSYDVVEGTNDGIVTMTINNAGTYYEGKAYFHFWLEGTDVKCNGVNANGTDTITFSCNFAQ